MARFASQTSQNPVISPRRLIGKLGIDQPKISKLLRGRLTRFSIERLMRFLLLLGQDIKINVQASPKGRSKALVLVA